MISGILILHRNTTELSFISKMVKEIVVIGAGVIGLLSALAVAEKYLPKDVHITVVALHLPDDATYSIDYTSPWAGAHFRPAPSRSAHEAREAAWTRVTQTYLKKLATLAPESSVEICVGEEYLSAPDRFYKEYAPGWREEMDDWEDLSVEKAKLKGAVMAVRYKTWVLNPPIYINYLYRKLRQEFSVDFVQATLTSLKQIYLVVPRVDAVINCLGRGLQYDGGYDPQCFPIRGQTLLVRPPAPFTSNKYTNLTVTHQDAQQQWTFCVKRPLNGGVIVGGTKQPFDLYNKPREKDTKDVFDRASKLFPELMKERPDGSKYFDVMYTNVGFRPAREGGFRLETEKIGSKSIIHAYGGGGMGYELSYGVGVEVSEKLADVISHSKF